MRAEATRIRLCAAFRGGAAFGRRAACAAAFLGLVAGAEPPLPLAAQQIDAGVRSTVDTLLTTSNIRDVLSNIADAVEAQVDEMAPELAEEERERIEEAVEEHFDEDVLYESVARSVAEEADRSTLAALMGWMTSGPVAEARRIADEYDPPLSLEEYASRLEREWPPQDRIELMVRLAEAQRAAPFYLIISETLRGAAHTLVQAVQPQIPPFRATPPDEARQAVQAYHGQSVLSFLHRFQPVSDELLATVAERYESDEGQWYVDAYTRAVGDAVLSAAERASAELKR